MDSSEQPLDATADSARPYVPGRIFYAVTGFVLAVGLYASTLPGWNWMLVMMAFFACGVIGLVWSIAFLVMALDTRLRLSSRAWARWLAVPAAGILVAGLMASGIPMQTRFELSRAALDEAADTLERGEHVNAGWIGLVPVDEAYVTDGMAVFVVDESGGFLSTCGYARVSGAKHDFGLVRQLTPSWWIWCDGID